MVKPDDEFADVFVFVTTAETSGFSAAARRLSVSRSAVAKAVARLEERIGARLFHRTTRHHNLTEAGQMFYERCQRAMAELQAGRIALDIGRTTVTGKLRVTMPVLFGRLWVAPVLTRLTASYPALDLVLNFSDRHADLLEDGFDLAVRMGDLGPGPGLMARRVAHERTILLAAPAYLERHGTPQTLDDLLAHPAIAYARGNHRQVWRFPRENAPPVEVTPPARLQLDDIDAIADAATAGYGLAWLPDWLVRARVEAGTLVPVFPGQSSMISDVHLIWPETPYLPTRVRVAINALAAELSVLSGDRP